MTQQQATELERAIEIAKDKGHKVFTATINATGQTAYTVRSHSDPNTFHILHIDGGRIRCDCTHHHHGHICSHAAAVRLFLIAQRDALKEVEAHDAAIYCKDCGRFQSHCDAMGHANPPAPWSRMAQESMLARAERALPYSEPEREFSIYR